MAGLRGHQKTLLSFRSDTMRVSYVLQNFYDIRKAKRDADDPSKIGTQSQPWDGWKLIKDKNHDEGVACLLRPYWGGRKAVSSAFLMADKVIALCGIEKYSWKEKWGIGRICLSALTYSGVYYLDREESQDPKHNRHPYYIYKTNDKKIKADDYLRDKSSFTPLPKWKSNTDEFGNKLVRPSHPCPPELEYTPEFPEDRTVPWLKAIHKMENIRFRINKEVLKWAEELDKKASPRIVPESMPGYAKRKKELDEEEKRINPTRLKEEFVPKKDWSETDVRWRDSKGFKDKKDLIAWNEYWKKYLILRENKNRYEAKRNAYEHHVKEANRLKDKPFYQRVSVDYRGTFPPRCIVSAVRTVQI